MKNKTGIFLSIVAPAFNEEEGIQEVINYWVDFLEKNEPSYEIIICDDGSSDNTWNILEKLSKKNHKIKNLRLKHNHGAAIAHSIAMSHSSGDWVLMIDSDGQFDIKDYKKLYEKHLETGAMAVIGERKTKKNDALANFGSALSTWGINMMLGVNLKDFSSVFKLINGDLARSLHLDSTGFEISMEVTAKLLEQKVSIASVVIQHHDRHAGKSKLKFIKAARRRYIFARYLAMRSRLLKKNIIRNEQSFVKEILKGESWK